MKIKRKKLTKKSDMWDILLHLIEEYGDACKVDEMKGGADPTSMPEIEANLSRTFKKLIIHIERMKRGVESGYKVKKHLQNVFPHLADKRMNELSADEKQDALEDWIRANFAFAHEPDHISFLLMKIDELRAKHK